MCLEYHSAPGKLSPFVLRKNFQGYLVKSAISYINEVQSSLKLDLNHIILKLSSLDQNQKFSPSIYTGYHILQSAYDSQNKTLVLDALHFLVQYCNDKGGNNNIDYSTILTEPYENHCIDTFRKSNPKDDFGVPAFDVVEMFPILNVKKYKIPPSSLKKAEEILSLIDMDLWKEYQAYVSILKIFQGKSLQGGTSLNCFGTVYLRMPEDSEHPVLYFLEHIVHETSHLHLYALAGDRDLVRNDSASVYDSPIRHDKRPIIGVFHATFVLARLVRIFQRYLNHFSNDYPEGTTFYNRISRDFKTGYSILKENCLFTTLGRQIFDSLDDCTKI